MLEQIIGKIHKWNSLRTEKRRARRLIAEYESSSSPRINEGYNKTDGVIAHEVVEAFVTDIIYRKR